MYIDQKFSLKVKLTHYMGIIKKEQIKRKKHKAVFNINARLQLISSKKLKLILLSK